MKQIRSNSLNTQTGFSLLELMMALAIFGILTALAVPQFSTWTQSVKLRSVAEALQNDLRLAQGEAIRQNHTVKFSLIGAPGATTPVIFTPASAGTTTCPCTSIIPLNTGTNWMAYTVPVLNSENYQYVAGGDNGNLESPVQIAGTDSSSTANGTIIFTPFGRLSGGLGQIYNITNSPGRQLRVSVSSSGQVRLCDPNRSITTAPDGC